MIAPKDKKDPKGKGIERAFFPYKNKQPIPNKEPESAPRTSEYHMPMYPKKEPIKQRRSMSPCHILSFLVT